MSASCSQEQWLDLVGKIIPTRVTKEAWLSGSARIGRGTAHLQLIYLRGMGLLCQALACCGAVVLLVDVNTWDFDKPKCITSSMVTASC